VGLDVAGGWRCPEHRRSGWNAPPAPEYGGRRWRRLRDAYIAEHPTCERCGAPAEHVHHRDHARPGDTTFYEWSNLEALCADCHRRATGRRGALVKQGRA
jgi:5-methylcytosine-specific restriction protein A